MASIAILLFIPLTIFAGIFYMEDRHYNLVAVLVLIECMLPFLLVFEGRKPKARELVTIAVLCAVGIAGRSAFFMLPQFKPVLALTIIAGLCLFANALVGNPVSKALATRTAKRHLADHYPTYTLDQVGDVMGALGGLFGKK